MGKPTPTLDRREVLSGLFPSPDEILFIAGLAGSARDAAGLTNDGDNLFTMAGTMGAAVPMGLGVALAAPDSQVVVVTGDGELLMNIGSLASVATMAPGNLSIVCIDNGCHGETGGQKGHTSNRTDLAKMAEGAGLASVMVLETADQMETAANFLTDMPAPRFLQVRVTDGPPTDYTRNMNPAQCRSRFRNAFLGIR
ncbi:MAG TPA: thiamine pyrophosphate-dependent enzyme [Rhodospirillales bacterium]|jgi:phosphonopyruvate decarboxylase|nr:thiamine pyrophosphate-dependent enzyme [Alphaproteobacteria bacterium]HJO74306.1 thiamine pyrophosphate-dependent enzyme [Rhodospirillales bacterium]